MKHHAVAAVGLLTAAILVPGHAQASAADPTGYWVKPDSERNAKIQITRCGKGKAMLCSNIIWLENPNDSKGRPIHDVRNENPSMRDRPILGLPLFTGMTRTGPSTWSGKIYNPEDGNTYSATLTMVSQKKIMLKGCKAWLLCGERMWLRTSPPPQPESTEEELIEAKAEPEAAPPAQAAAGAIPAAVNPQPAPTSNDLIETAAKPQAETEPQAVPAVELAAPAQPPAEHDMRPGYGFLSVSTGETTAEELTGENVPSMFTMADPIETEEMAPPVKEAAPMPAPKPAATQATAAAMPKPKPQPAQPAAQADARMPSASTQPAAQADARMPSASTQPEPQADDSMPKAAQQAALDAEPEGVETSEEATPPMTRRQKRMLRRQQRQMLPWLR